jgi:hypothetical protein
VKRSQKTKLKTTEKILIICEGQTEESYINQLLKDFNLMTPNITIELASGGGYNNYKNYIERNKALYSIILVVCDLDRAAQHSAEKISLKSLIKLLQKENLKNNIFLSNPEIEVWFAACVGVKVEGLNALRYEKGKTVSKFLRANGGDYKKACKYFEGQDMYFEKRSFKRGIYKEKAITIPHSNLIYFIEYMEALIKI